MENQSEITNAYGTFKGPLLRHPNKNAPWLIFLHGFPDDSSVWSFQIEALKDRFQIWAPDIYLHPFSHQVNGVAKFLQEIRPDAEVYIVAHDMGGPVAGEIARRFPERVSKILLINTFTLGLFLSNLKDPRQWIKSSYMTLFTGPMHSTKWWSALAGPFLKKAHDLGEVAKDDPIRNNPREVIEGIKRYREISQEIPHFLKSENKKIQVETNFLFGSRDAFLQPPKESQLQENYQKHSVETIAAGHWVQRSNASEVSEWIKRMV
jgi:pimeloyl-ACP methyl ester carboxylesterase